MDTIHESKVVTQSLEKAWYAGAVDRLDMLRLDLIHPIVSGNKWFKLRLNVHYALDHGFKTIVTFGGGYSNHLVATAYTAKMFGIPCVGIVRGTYEPLTPTLQQCRDLGMKLEFVTHEDYKNKHQPGWAEQLVAHFDELYIIPEGGANERGRAGAGLIDRFVGRDYTHIVTSVGTGTTFIGLRNKLDTRQQVMGMVPMKQGNYLEGYVREHLHEGKDHNWQLFDQWHFGGFGKNTPELIDFMNQFYTTNRIPLDVVYTSKMMYGVRELLMDGYFPADARVLCIHSGGLQGNASVSSQLKYGV